MARLASVGQLGRYSQIFSKFQIGFNDLKVLENIIYIMMRGRETNFPFSNVILVANKRQATVV